MTRATTSLLLFNQSLSNMAKKQIKRSSNVKSWKYPVDGKYFVALLLTSCSNNSSASEASKSEIAPERKFYIER